MAGVQRVHSVTPNLPLLLSELLARIENVAEPLCLAYVRSGSMNVCQSILSHLLVDSTKFDVSKIVEGTSGKTLTSTLKRLVTHFFPSMVLTIIDRNGKVNEVFSANGALDASQASEQVASWMEGGALLVLDEFGQAGVFLYRDSRLVLKQDIDDLDLRIFEHEPSILNRFFTDSPEKVSTLEKGDFGSCSPSSQVLLEQLYSKFSNDSFTTL